MRFMRAIVRTPGTSMIKGLTGASLGRPDYDAALIQHAAYIDSLQECGLDVNILPPDDRYPDSTFVEDTALLTSRCAIITRPGAPSRRDEIIDMEETLRDFYSDIERIVSPGTVDAGDIMMVENHFFIGLSQRTNAAGAAQIIGLLERHGLTGSTVPLSHMLHLKSGAAYLENNCLVLAGELIGRPEFSSYETIPVDNDEMYAANCLWVNDTVLVADGFSKIRRAVENRGYRTIVLDMSEFRKLDGGLSCLSLRF